NIFMSLPAAGRAAVSSSNRGFRPGQIVKLPRTLKVIRQVKTRIWKIHGQRSPAATLLETDRVVLRSTEFRQAIPANQRCESFRKESEQPGPCYFAGVQLNASALLTATLGSWLLPLAPCFHRRAIDLRQPHFESLPENVFWSPQSARRFQK